MNNINIKITTTIISAIAALSLASCGETGDSVAPRREIKDTSSSVSENDTSSVAETTSSSKTTTTTAKAESEKSSVTTTSIVVLKDGKGNIVTQFAVDESGKTISLDKDSKAKTTTKKSTTGSADSSAEKSTATKKTSNGTTNNNTSGSVTYNTYTYDNGNSGNYNNYSDNTSDNSGYSDPQPAQTETPKKTTTTTTTTTAAPAPAPAANWLDNLSDLDRAYYNFAYGDFSDYDWNLICDDLEKRALSYNGKKGSVDLMVNGIYWPTVNYTFDGTIMIKRREDLWVGRDSKGWYNGTYSGGFNPGNCKDGLDLNNIEDLNWFKGDCYANVDDAVSQLIYEGWFDDDDFSRDEFIPGINFDWYITAGVGGQGKDAVLVVLRG